VAPIRNRRISYASLVLQFPLDRTLTEARAIRTAAFAAARKGGAATGLERARGHVPCLDAVIKARSSWS
jgi:hypothetical protein